MESEGPAATLSMSLPHPEIHYEPSDYEDCLNGSTSGNTTRCTPVTSGLPAQLNGLCHDDDLRQRCNGTAASSPITSGTMDEPMETTSESEPERSHSSNSEPTAADVDELLQLQGPPEEARAGSPPAHGSPGSAAPFGGKIICNADGVICFVAKQESDCDVSEFWPAFSSSYIHDFSSATSPTVASSISSTVPSVLFPFHTVAYIPPSAVCTVQFFDCQLPCSPPSDVLDLYQNLPLSYVSPSSQESQRNPLYVCLVCAPLQFEDQFTFLQHAESQHNLPCSGLEGSGLTEDRSAIIQADGTDRVPVISWLKPIPQSRFESGTRPSKTDKLSEAGRFRPLGEEDSAEAEPDVQPVEFETQDLDDLVASSSKASLEPMVVDTQTDVEDADDGEPPLRIMLDEGAGDQPSELPENGHDDSDSVHSFAEDLSADHHHHHHHHHHHNEEGVLTNGNCKSSSIECPKCDIVLGSSKSLGGHMTMVHSRNSSKTLKCPKCNWHYKYQETLEIHMKEKHPEAEETCPYCLTGQAHPRLARGEVYSCGYKPYRCDICNYSTTSKGNLTIHMQSDKHVNNVQERHKNGGEPVGPVADRSSPVEEPQSIPRSSSTSSNSRGLSRCDMCNYETNVSRNLRIHMTSEKHQQNANLFLQARLQEISLHSAAAAQTGLLDQAAIMQLMGMGHSDLMAAAYRSSLAGAPPTGDPAVLSPKRQPSIAKIPDNALSFQCLICMNFMTDSLEELREHVTRDRSDPRPSDTATPDTNDGLVNGQSYCKYCQYGTKLKANFQLHCKTDKHVQKMQLVNHVREGGTDNAWRLQYLNTSNPVQLRCNACDYQTTSLSQLRIHVENSQQHELNVAALQKIPQIWQLDDATTSWSSSSTTNLQNASSSLISSTKTRKWKLFCSLCTFTAKSQSSFMQHIRSPTHFARWKQYAKNPFPGTLSGDDPDLAFFISVKPLENLADVQQLFEAQHRNNGDPADLSDGQDGDQSDRDDILSSTEEPDPEDLDGSTKKFDSPSQQVSSGPAFVCPLCQDPSKGKDALETHLMSKHNVHAEALERLMMLVENSDIWTTNHSQRSRDTSPTSSNSEKIFDAGDTSDTYRSDTNRGDTHRSDTHRGDTGDTYRGNTHRGDAHRGDTYRCQKCAVTFDDIDKLYVHQNESGHLELKQTPKGPGYLCWKKGCNQYFPSVNSLQMHFRQIHAAKKTGESGDEEEIFDENSQFDSAENFVEGDDELNSSNLAESGYRDFFRKFKCHRCKVAFTKQIYLTAHNKTLQHRKGEKNNYPMEKFLDPNRPHKCDVCKESFTQKNILLVHFNSVSHLHKKKKYQHQHDVSDGREMRQSPSRTQTPPAAHPSSPTVSVLSHQKRNGGSFEDESKPYRCRVCQIGYTNSSTLDIHVRSVGHQARVARAANNVVDLSKLSDDFSTNGTKNTFLKTEEESDVTQIRNEKSDSSPNISRTEFASPNISRTDLPDSTSSSGVGRPRVFGRARGNFGWSSMMENIGMEMVQHYLENGQKTVRKPKDTTMEPVEGENQIPASVVDNECSRCHKVFSSPWILKVHRESAHADIVPVRVLETVASEYRKTHCEKPQRKRSHPEQQQNSSKSTTNATASTVEISTKKKPTSPQPQTPSSSSNATAGNNNFSTADLLAAQMQLFMYPGIAMSNLGMMGMQAAMMNLQPPLIGSNGQFNVNMANAMDQARSSTNNQQAATSSSSRVLLDAQSGQKRNRTRITDEQLQILRGHFDIRNPPSDELLQKLCEQTGLELKVVKHWYRNTLFKERQRNKDSPYNFSVPPNPSTTMADQIGELNSEALGDTTNLILPVPAVVLRNEELEEPRMEAIKVIKREQSVESIDSRPSFRESSMTYNPMTPSPTPMHLLSDAMREERNTGKRANRTRFTDFQVKALQDYFDKNAYPKDDDLEELSRVLDLSPRVITVWFQNARQKARKSYENTTPPQEEAPLIRTPSLNYQCKKCLQVFQRYYELIRHQRAQCSGTSAGLGNGMGNGGAGSGKDADDACSVTSATESISSSKAEQLTSSQHERVVWDPSMAGMPAGMLTPGASFMFPGLYPPNSPFGVLQMEAISNAGQSRMSSPSPVKRRPSSEDEDEESPSNKRVRTTIQPEQLDYLYQQYRLDSNPSRKQLEMIASKTGLKKRVVQVWYQNTRARERKGQLNLHQMAVSKRCPVCRLHFSVRAALETHISVKHADVYCKGDINIDDLPDTAGESEDEKSASTSSPVPQKRKPSPQPSAVPSVTSMNESMKRYYEDVMKKYMQGGPDVMSLPVNLPVASSSKQQEPPKAAHPQGDAPLDLSAPHPKCPSSSVSGQYFSVNEDSRSFAVDEDGSDDGRSMSSNTLGLGGSRAGKRFRTQMSNAQLKVMKRLFTEYKTPTMGECELVGREIGLPKRVVQVWFQNARAKEKKNRLAGVEPEKGPTTDHCALCKVTFNAKLTLQDHLFTKSHIELLKQSEDCHDGPLPTNMLARLTSPVPTREARGGPSSSSSGKKSMDVIQERSKVGTVQSGSGKGSSSAKTDSVGSSSSHGIQAMPMSPFGDLGTMMMNDPNLQMAYMYASMNPYYNPAAMTGLLNPYAGLGGFYDPAVMGTSLQMLQLPPGVGEMIYAKLGTSDRGNSGQSAVAFAQDGKKLSDLRECISPADFACATSSQTDIGSVCRKCQMVFPTEANCKSHQASMCYPGTKDVKNVLKLQQIHFHCSACQKQYATVSEFKNHCNSSSHQKSRQSLPSFKRNQPSSGLEENGSKKIRHE